ncbi:dTDP-4-dehydrorhamnose reductase [Halobaculum sp. WSA2]|uniref:dTDP-4-dehydrorhamnose reductase n=1 Tax=Halobaculum saliterrae TaxID=2073113 RepID=A0A6B0SVU3_9EURY|nr:dTDP-4-dehydrorhamnose reductase [Halobaculum saliterrae]MXR40781.1 dTDP-4-dehydrorhamnose reductase [Halobaculum saliterrae]
MRSLVVGANGLLGSAVVHAARQRDWTVFGTYHSTSPAFDIPLTQFDLRDHGSFVDVLVDYDPDVVINCAAMTDVDGCEGSPEQADILNGQAPGALAAHCEEAGIQFVHVSTDYVFDGTSRTPYREDSEPAPVQVYGASKLAGERSVRREHEAALITRLSFVWGIHRGREELTGFPAWVREQIRSGESVPLFTDQWVTPTRAGQAADTLLDLIESGETGLYHVACPSCVTPFEFGSAIADALGTGEELLEEGSVADVQRDASRPTYSCLDMSRVEEALGRPQPTLRDDIAAVGNAFR